MARIKITKLPKALSGLEIKMQPGLYGTNGNKQFSVSNYIEGGKIAQQPTEVRNTLQPVSREEANLEAEKGETAVLSLGGLPAHFKIGGKRHHSGGTPLNLPDNSFIFSDTAKMKITDPIILAQFGMVPKKSGYTPAEIAKKYDINKFRQVLADPNSEDVERKTAEAMITNYNMKLAKLALIQESMKGFPQGIPQIAMPYIIANNIDPNELGQTEAQEEQSDEDTGEARYGGNMISNFPTKKFGGLPKAQTGLADIIQKEKQTYTGPTPSFYEAAEAMADQTRKAQLLEHYRNALKAKKEGNVEKNWHDYVPFTNNSAEKEYNKFLSKAEDIGIKKSDVYIIDKILSIPGMTDVLNNPDNYKLYNKVLANPVEVYKNLLKPKVKTKIEKNPTETVEPTSTTPTTTTPVTTTTTTQPVYKTNSNSVIVKKQKPVVREKAIEIEAYGGSTGLNEYQDGGKTIVDYEYSKSKKQSRPIYSDNTKGEFENTESIVSPENYTKLEALHKKAYEFDPQATGKDKNEAARQFQELYHQILPNTARNIISKEGITEHGRKIGKKYWELPTNEDSRYGKRTKQYWEALQGIKKEVPSQDEESSMAGANLPEVNVSPDVKTPYVPERHPVTLNPVSQKAPWFIQNAIETGLGLKNLLTPYRARPEKFQADWVVPGGVYKSPDQAINAIQSDAASARQAQAAINNPQSLAAASALSQGQAARAIAGEMANTENYNVGIANNLAGIRANILNQASQDRAANNRLFKRETDIEGQQYHNTKRADEAQFVNLLNAGITNSANAFNLNQLNENYKTNPWSGGKINFVADKNAIKANKNYDQGNIWDEYSKAIEKTGNAENAIKLLQMKYKINPNSNEYDPNALASYPGSGYSS